MKSKSIWSDYQKNKINAAQAFEQINQALRGASINDQAALYEISKLIIDAEVPMTERDLDAEETYSARMVKDEE